MIFDYIKFSSTFIIHGVLVVCCLYNVSIRSYKAVDFPLRGNKKFKGIF